MHELTLSMGSVLTPLTLILGAIWPLLMPESITEASLPLSCVDGSTLERIGRPFLTALVGIESLLR
jgi:hypothetical protein